MCRSGGKAFKIDDQIPFSCHTHMLQSLSTINITEKNDLLKSDYQWMNFRSLIKLNNQYPVQEN